MSNREAFRQSIEEYLKRGRKNWELFANTLGYRREHVSRILHGKAKMPEGFERHAVIALAKLGCIRGREQARNLLRLMDILDFSLADWSQSPLATLDDAVSSHLTVVAEASISEQETVPDAHQSASFPLWTVPYLRNPFFTGRSELLDQLHQQLTDTTTTRRAALTQPQAIKGLGGIGKTQIAVEYAYRSRDLYACIFWLNAATEEALIASFAKIAEVLLPSFTAKNETDQKKLVKAIKQWLEQFEHRWLLIFDNVEDVSGLHEYLPQRGNGSILLTTRANAPGSLAASIEVEKMGWMEGTELLLRRTQRFDQVSDEERNEAGNIVIALDHFPLALDQAGAYIEETKCRFVDYLEMYQDHRKALLARRGTQATNYPDSVATTWSLSFQKVEQANPAAAELLRLCAFLAPDRIPEELIRDGSMHWTPLLQQASTDLFAFNQMIAELLRFSLLKRLTEDQMLSIHRLVQAVQMDRMEQQERHHWAERVVRAVNGVFPRESQDATTWSQCLRYLEQAQACDSLIQYHMLTFTEAADMLRRTGIYFVEHGLYTIAEPLYERALSIYKRQLEPTLLDTARGQNNLAILYLHQGKYEQAEPLYQSALAIREQQLGPTHPDTARSLNNLAILYYHQCKYEQAESLYQQALSIYERYLEPTHPDTSRCLNNLANLYWIQGKYEQAEQLYQQVLSIREQQLGPTHTLTATVLSNLASCYYELGKHKKAKQLYLRTHAIREQHLGPTHPDTASCLSGLALLLQSEGKYNEAEPLFQRVLHIKEQALGPNHHHTGGSLNELALLYRISGEYSKAEPLFLRALSIYELQLGSDHISTGRTLGWLAVLYGNQGKYNEAEPLFLRALSIYEQHLGSKHPDLAELLYDIASLRQAQGHYKESESFYRRALAIHERVHGPQHPKTTNSRDGLRDVLVALGRMEEAAQLDAPQPEPKAEPLFQQVLSHYEHELGSDHITTGRTLRWLAVLYGNQGKYNEAEPLFLRALSIYEQRLGSTHPDLAELLYDFASLRQAQDNYKEARSLYERALAIRIQTLGSAHFQTKTTYEHLQVVLDALDEAEQVAPMETVQVEHAQIEKEQQ